LWLVRDSNSPTVYDAPIPLTANDCKTLPAHTTKYTNKGISKHSITSDEAHETAHGKPEEFSQTNLNESGYLETNTNLPCTRNTLSHRASGLSTPIEGACYA
jgi:hypothetical protein